MDGFALYYEVVTPTANDFSARACPVCGGRDHRPALQKASLTIVSCRNCSMLFASPVPSELLDGRFYNREGAKYYTSAGKLRGDFAAIRYRRESELFQRYCGAGRVLDVGCNTGAFLHQLQNVEPGKYEVMGIDVSAPALEEARKAGVPVLQGPFDRQEFGDHRFDAVTFWAVLEHLDQPLQFLRKATAVLKPRGFCFVLVPNMRSLAVRLLRSRYRYIMPEHINYFTADTLSRLAAAASGFKEIEITTSHFNPAVIWQDLVRPRREVPSAERAALLERTNLWKSNPRLKPIQWAYKKAEALLSCSGLADNLVMVLQRS